MTALTPEQIIERAKAKEVAKIIPALARQIVNSRTLEHAFEQAGCTCHPARGQMEKLEAEQEQDLKQQLLDHMREATLDSPIFQSF